MPSRRRIAAVPAAAATAVLAALAALALGGCGLGSGAPPGSTQLLVTQDFGSQVLVAEDHPDTGGQDTVMRLLQRNAPKVTTKFGGGFVQSIGGQSGGQRGGHDIDWFFYVNGSLSDKGAASVNVHEGDRVWWDLHDWTVTDRIPAVVGSFPEPFLHGLKGRRLPTRVECAQNDDPCQTVQDKLVALDIPAAKGGIGTSYTEETLRILVGPWPALQQDVTARQIDQGPARSGVFAKFGAGGKRLTLYDAQGRATRTLGPGTGLIAASQSSQDLSEPVWVVTGTDARGIAAAAQALDEGALAGKFAAAVIGGRPVRLPDQR